MRSADAAPLRRSLSLPLLVPLLAPALVGCGPDTPAPRTLVLEGLRPTRRDGVYLNEELVLTFSAPVDPTSVSGASLSIVDDGGRPARGRWTVTGLQVRFQPAPVLARTLDDGGYRPGTRYVLEVAGFPRLDGLRGEEGTPLGRSYRFAFTTVSVGEGQGGFVFDDASPGVGHPVKIGPRLVLAPGEPLVLRCAEPLDPSSLDDDDFWLVPDAPPRGRGGPDGEGPAPRIPLRGRFVANDPEGSAGPLGDCARIELLAVETLQPGAYVFRSREVGLTDFRGHRVWPPVAEVQLRVVSSPRSRSDRLHLTFLDRLGFSSMAVPGADGVAHWTEQGLLAVRYPAAAGTGEHGPVTLVGTEGRGDLHGTRVVVPAGEQADLAPGPGMRIVRAQRRLEIAGRLVRRAGDAADGDGAAGREPFAPGETLSAWLERTAAEGASWTVLVAGGDLVIDGEVDVDTPLLLVAGGWIRVEGRVRQRKGQLWLLREGGGLSVDPTASVPPLVLDAPRTNPLRETLHLATATAPLPSQVQPYRWLSAEAGGRAGAGHFRVSFLPAQGAPDPEQAVLDPRLLPRDGQLRVLIELEVPPGPVWDPPSLDFVDLTWELPD